MGAGSSNEEAGMSKSNSGTVMAGASSDEEGIGRWPESRVFNFLE